MNILFTICGRAGSKGVKNKNIKSMNGVPLLYYSLAAIKLFEENNPEMKIDIVINTDSNELVRQAKIQQKVENIRFAIRQEELAGDVVAKIDVIRDCFLHYAKKASYDVIVDLDLTSPMRREKDIKAAIDVLLEDELIDLVYSVVPGRRSPYFNMVEQKGNYYKKICDSDFTTRQQAPKIFELNASIYAYKPQFFKKKLNKSILDYNGKIIKMPDYLVLDIDSEEDFEMMSYLIEYFSTKDAGLKAVLEEASKINSLQSMVSMP